MRIYKYYLFALLANMEVEGAIRIGLGCEKPSTNAILKFCKESPMYEFGHGCYISNNECKEECKGRCQASDYTRSCTLIYKCEWDISEPEASTTTSTTKLSTPYYTMLSEISTGTTLMDKQKATGVDQLLLVICPLTIVIFLICTSILVYFIKKMRTKNDQQENIVMQEINP